MVDEPSRPQDRAKTVHNYHNYTIANSNDNEEHHQEDRSASTVADHQDWNEKASNFTNTTVPNPPAEPPPPEKNSAEQVDELKSVTGPQRAHRRTEHKNSNQGNPSNNE